MKGFIVFIILVGLMISIPMTIEKKNTVQGYFKEDIVALWKHRVNEYSVTTQNGNKLTDKYLYYEKDIDIIMDVPIGSNMWYSGTYKECYNTRTYDKLEVHIHSINDINGAGWSAGKSGSGRTERVTNC